MNVLFVCTANGGRSVISERLLEREAAGRHHARSAGSMPGAAAHPEVVEALGELGIDASDHVPQKLSQELIDWADVVVATCDDSCPYVPGKHYVNWQLPDPKGRTGRTCARDSRRHRRSRDATRPRAGRSVSLSE